GCPENRTCGEVDRESMKELCSFRVIAKPPKIRQKGKAIHVNVLWCDQLKQPHAAVCAAVAAVFNATPGCLGNAVRVKYFVDHHSSRFDAFANSSSPGCVFCPHAGGETIGAVIRQFHSFSFSLECHYRKHGAEGLLAHDHHAVVNVSNHRRLVEKAPKTIGALSSGDYFRAVPHCIVYVFFDNSELLLI